MSEQELQQIVSELISKFEANLLAKIHSGALERANPPQVDDALHAAISQNAEAWGLRELEYSPKRDGLPNSLDEARVWMQVKHPEHWVDDKSKYEATLQVQRDFQLLSLAKRDPVLDLTGLSLPDALKVIREKYPDFAEDLDRRFDPELVIVADDEEEEDDDELFWSKGFEQDELKYTAMQLELLELMFHGYEQHNGKGVLVMFFAGEYGEANNITVRQHGGADIFSFDITWNQPKEEFLQTIAKLDPTLIGLTLEKMVEVLRGRVK